MVYENPSNFRWNTFFGKSKAEPANAMWFGGIVTISNKEGTFEESAFRRLSTTSMLTLLTSRDKVNTPKCGG